MLQFHKAYFTLTLLLFIAEVFIGVYLHDQYIRPYGGDLLVVILIYCFFKSFFNTPVGPTAIGVLLFAYLVEISQYFHLVNRIGLGKSTLAVILLGNSFSWTDIFCYTSGMALVMLTEQINSKSKNAI